MKVITVDKLVFVKKNVSSSKISVQTNSLGFLDLTQISDIVELSFFHFYIAFSTKFKDFYISLTVTSRITVSLIN